MTKRSYGQVAREAYHDAIWQAAPEPWEAAAEAAIREHARRTRVKKSPGPLARTVNRVITAIDNLFSSDPKPEDDQERS